MRTLVACDAYIFVLPDGSHWTDTIYGYDFWLRYLHVFDEVKIVARTKHVSEKNEKWIAVDGKGVTFAEVPFYRGPVQLFRKYISIQKALKKVDEDCDVAILRMPSQTALMTWHHLRKYIPTGGEIVYDPINDLEGSSSPAMKIINWIIVKNLKKFCLKANGVSYVTENAIQKHFPSEARLHGTTEKNFETYYSTITLHDEAFSGPRSYVVGQKMTLALSSVAMNSERKGERILIQVVKKCRDKGYDVEAVIIGDGDLRCKFEEYAESISISKYIRFTGLLPSSDAVRKELLKADMYIFPTQGEGLPRGILEAMAIGMPVLSTPVGGIPEVLDEDCLFDPKDVDGFTDKICHLIDNATELNRLSRNNYNKALHYKNSILQTKRDLFYRKLADLVKR